MAQATEHNDTGARMRAITAAEIIGDLMREGLPLVAWTVEAEHDEDNDRFPTLVGICHAQTGREDVVRAYGEHFGVEPRDPHGDGRYLDVVAEVRGIWMARGVRVRVWALADGAR
ncbi:MAG TPA: hypothetical protein VGL93_10935 [Streptosporangiaceae bacterium]|jgi:hypothetical protein